MREGHIPHVSLTGKGRKPSAEATPRELDFVRAVDGIQRTGRDVTMAGLSASLGVQISSVTALRDRCVDRGLVCSTGFGSTRRITITGSGRQSIGGG